MYLPSFYENCIRKPIFQQSESLLFVKYSTIAFLRFEPWEVGLFHSFRTRPSHHKVILQQRVPAGNDMYSFCEDENKIFAKPLGFEPRLRPAGPSKIFSLIHCQLSYWVIRCEQLFDQSIHDWASIR